MSIRTILLLILVFFSYHNDALGQIIPIGAGSYTETFPGTDQAGRNGVPPGSPQVSGNAINRPVPTNDWWSRLVQENHAGNLFNYPMTMKTTPAGLVVSYIPWGVIDDQEPIIVGVEGLNASRTTVSDFNDWTVTMNWSDAFEATSGIGMPFIYFNRLNSSDARIIINLGTVTIIDEVILVENARNGADFAIYAPQGSTWVKDGNSYSSNLDGKDYWSMAMLPNDAGTPASLADEYKEFAYVFPVNTEVSWSYNSSTAVVRSELVTTVEVKEGTGSNVLQGLLPHHWSNLAADSPYPDGHKYSTVRGELKTLAGNSFSVENKFFGILPTLPYLSNYSDGFDVGLLNEKVELLKNDGLSTWTDSYNEGQMMNRLIQTARIANKIGNLEARDLMIATIKERLEDWLTAEASEVAFLFHYNENWSTLLGYPAGHGQDTNINDHHFHWGYFIHAASFMEQFEPGWADQWGEMVNQLVQDAASSDRNDNMYPFLRNFSPFAGHCWANGFASFPQGNDQESTSESMQFNSALIHWGSITGNEAIRDLGIYLYTTEQSAIEEYWFDMYERNFQPSQTYSLVSRVWGNSYDNGTFWTNDIAASYGIELYPIHGGSMYLGHNADYATKLWAEIENNTGILNNEENDNLWHDTMWKYLAFTNPVKAIELYDSYPERNLKFGVSDAQTYYWIHAMNAVGKIDTSVTADHPTAVVFNKNGNKTHVAHNYSESNILVEFSDGYQLEVAAGVTATSLDISVMGSLHSSFPGAYPGGSVELEVIVNQGTPTKVEYYKNGEPIGTTEATPFKIVAGDLSFGVHSFYAKVYDGDAFNVTNIVKVQVGDQSPYPGLSHRIPGAIEAGHYDQYQGGKGQGIAYVDTSPGNNGGFRPTEDVDASNSGSEGTTIGWITAGEWTEYTVQVDSSGLYEMSFRFASNNQAGGGPFHLEIDGERISEDISLNSTGDWDAWQTKLVQNLPLHEGDHVLRLVFENGEFNLGRMDFTFSDYLPYNPPIAKAGDNVSVMLPESTATLDGSASTDDDGDLLTYLWSQVNGPSIIEFSDETNVTTLISNLLEGVYTVNLEVSDGGYSSADQVLIIVSETGNSPPTVAITSPADNSSFEQGTDINISAIASDLEGPITLVEFYDGESKIGDDVTSPFNVLIVNPTLGAHSITAKATDENNETSTSEAVTIHVTEVMECATTSNEAQQGSFSIGYIGTFKTVGTTVTITFELLDNDKTGVEAFLWQESPFAEQKLEHVSGKKFATTIQGLTAGSTLSYACKFAFSGGLAVTKYLQYEVGTSCIDTGNPDLKGPENFVVNTGNITETSIELILSATDDSGKIDYTVYHGQEALSKQGNSGEETRINIANLLPGAEYNFSVTAKDPAGNSAQNSPIEISAKTKSTVLSISEVNIAELMAYPNPVNDVVFVDLPGVSHRFVNLISLSGKKETCKIENHPGQVKLNVSNLSRGIYLIVLENPDGLNFVKFIKQ